MAFNRIALAAIIPLICFATACGVAAKDSSETVGFDTTETVHNLNNKGQKMDKCIGQPEANSSHCPPFNALDLMKEGSAQAQAQRKDTVTKDAPIDPTKAVGDAWLDDKGNLMLQMRRTSDGIPVDSLEKLAPGTKDYDEVWKHIGGVKPGEKKLVLPWPETM